MHRLIELQHDVVGGVYNVIDGPDADRFEATSQPVRRGPDLYSQDDRRQKPGTPFEVLGGRTYSTDFAAGTYPAHRWHIDGGRPRDDRQPERHCQGCGQLARQPLVPEQVGPVRTDVNDEPVIGYGDGFEEASARRRFGAELPDAVSVLPQPELARGAQHAFGGLAPEFALFDAEPARKRGSDRREGILPSCFYVRGTAHDIPPFDGSIVHDADPEPIGVGVRTHFLDQSDDNVTQPGVERFDGVHRRTKHGQPLGDVFDVQLAAEEVFQPAEGDVHGTNCSRNRMSPSYNSRMSGMP
jgi:hypothetical protein